jgi:hypothetical protein
MGALRRAGLALALGGILAANAAPTFTADNGTVEASVTVATPCLVVTPGQIDFGTLPFSTTQISFGVAPISYTNCSESPERVYGRGTDASGGGSATWSLSTVPCNGTLNNYTQGVTRPGNPATFLTTTDLELETVAGNLAGAYNQASITMPCAGSDGTGSYMSFQFIFTATF